MTVDQQKSWLVQWQAAGTALAKIREEELASLDDVGRLRILDRLSPISHALNSQKDTATSGLVRQQELFLKELRK